MDKEYIGVLEDPRTSEEKSYDFNYDGLAKAGDPVKWEEKTTFKSYKIKNQDGSSSCVAQATAKMLGVHEVVEGRTYKDLSPKFIYTRRSNYPSGGMWFHNALEIACNSGACLESLMPSDMQNEAFMNDRTQEPREAMVDAFEYRGRGYINVMSGYQNGFAIVSIDKIADVLSQGLPVLLGFRFDYNEWTAQPFINPNSTLECHHGVLAIDYGLINGQKVLSIDDSWGPGHGKGGTRIITEAFLTSRCTYAGYTTTLIKEVAPVIDFKYNFTRWMRFNDIRNNRDDVRALQKGLQLLGIFPLNAVIDGLFGPITRKAVIDFQRRNGLTADAIVGTKSLAVLNKLFN